MTPPKVALLLVKVLLVILNEEPSVAMTTPPPSTALLSVKVLLVILNEE